MHLPIRKLWYAVEDTAAAIYIMLIINFPV